MPDFGSPVAQNIRPPDPQQGIQAISGMMGLRQKQQDYETGAAQQQSAQAEAQKQQQLMGERQLQAEMHKTGIAPDGTRITDDKGEIIPEALSKANTKFLPNIGQQSNHAIIETLNKRIQLNDAVRGLGQNYKNDLSGIARSSINSDNGVNEFIDKADFYVKQNPAAKDAVDRAKWLASKLNGPLTMAVKNKGFLHLAQELQPASETRHEQSPVVGTSVSSSNNMQYDQRNPMSPFGMGKLGPEVQTGVPKNLEVADAAGGKKYIGSNSIDSQGEGKSAALSPMQLSAIGNWQKHWGNTVEAAAKAPQNITLLENARDNAKKAVTGSGEGWKNWVINLGSAFDFTPSNNAKDNLDLYKKELSQFLANKGQAGTDMSRVLNDAGTPGQHMNDGAMNKAFSGLIAQEKMALAQHAHFSEANNDPKAYDQKFKDWSKINDYRAMQWNDLDANEKKELIGKIKSRGPVAAENFRNAIDSFQKMGHVK